MTSEVRYTDVICRAFPLLYSKAVLCAKYVALRYHWDYPSWPSSFAYSPFTPLHASCTLKKYVGFLRAQASATFNRAGHRTGQAVTAVYAFNLLWMYVRDLSLLIFQLTNVV